MGWFGDANRKGVTWDTSPRHVDDFEGDDDGTRGNSVDARHSDPDFALDVDVRVAELITISGPAGQMGAFFSPARAQLDNMHGWQSSGCTSPEGSR